MKRGNRTEWPCMQPGELEPWKAEKPRKALPEGTRNRHNDRHSRAEQEKRFRLRSPLVDTDSSLEPVVVVREHVGEPRRRRPRPLAGQELRCPSPTNSSGTTTLIVASCATPSNNAPNSPVLSTSVTSNATAT